MTLQECYEKAGKKFPFIVSNVYGTWEMLIVGQLPNGNFIEESWWLNPSVSSVPRYDQISDGWVPLWKCKLVDYFEEESETADMSFGLALPEAMTIVSDTLRSINSMPVPHPSLRHEPACHCNRLDFLHNEGCAYKAWRDEQRNRG